VNQAYERGSNDAQFGSCRPPEPYLPGAQKPNPEHTAYMSGYAAQQRKESGLPPKKPGPAYRPNPERAERALPIKDRLAGLRYLRGRAD